MKNSFKLILLVILITAISCNQNKKNNSNPKQDYSETEKLIKEICNKSDSYYFDFFKEVKYSMRRGTSYITDVKNGHRVHLQKIKNQYFYASSPDFVLYDLDKHSKEFEDKYEWDIDRAKEFIDFCYEFKLMQLFVREEEPYIALETLNGDIIYTKDQSQFNIMRKICSNWYFTGNEYYR